MLEDHLLVHLGLRGLVLLLRELLLRQSRHVLLLLLLRVARRVVARALLRGPPGVQVRSCGRRVANRDRRMLGGGRVLARVDQDAVACGGACMRAHKSTLGLLQLS